MADVGFSFQTPPQPTGAGVKRTHLQILARANQRVVVGEVSVSGDSGDPTAAGMLVEVESQDAAGSTPSSTGPFVLAATKENPDDAESVQTTALRDFLGSTQPGTLVNKLREYVSPQGALDRFASFRKQIRVPGATRLGIAITSPINVNVTVAFRECEE